MERIKQFKEKLHSQKKPLKVTVTGAAGNLGYALVFMIGQGSLLGPDQPINLCLLEIEAMADSLKGVEMELKDCSFSLLSQITATTDPQKAFQDCDVALLVGARPRGPGMDRG